MTVSKNKIAAMLGNIGVVAISPFFFYVSWLQHKQPFDKVEIKNSSDAKNKVRTKKQFEMVTNDVMRFVEKLKGGRNGWY